MPHPAGWCRIRGRSSRSRRRYIYVAAISSASAEPSDCATVRAGKRDTVASIAQRYKVKAADVADWNDLKLTGKFKAGEKVVMYLPVRLTAIAQARTGARPAAGKAPAHTTAKVSPKRKGGTPSKRKRCRPAPRRASAVRPAAGLAPGP